MATKKHREAAPAPAENNQEQDGELNRLTGDQMDWYLAFQYLPDKEERKAKFTREEAELYRQAHCEVISAKERIRKSRAAYEAYSRLEGMPRIQALQKELGYTSNFFSDDNRVTFGELSQRALEQFRESQDEKNRERGSKLARIAERTRAEDDSGDREPTTEELEQRAQESYDAVMQRAQEEYTKSEQKLAEQRQRMQDFNERLHELQRNSPAERMKNEIASRQARRTLDEAAAKEKRKETLQRTGLSEAQLSGVESLERENERDAELQLFFDSNEKLKLARDLIEGQDEATAKKNRQEHPELAKYFKIVEGLTQKRKSNKESSIWMATSLSKVPKELADSIINRELTKARSTQEKDEQFAQILDALEQYLELKEEYEKGRAEQRELEQSERDAKKTVRDLEKTTGLTAGFKKRKAQKELDKITEQTKTKRTQNDELWKKRRSLRDEVARINNLLSNEVMSIME